MNLKKFYLAITHDSPEFTDEKNQLNLCLMDIEMEYNKYFKEPVPIYIDMDEIENKRR